MAGRRKASGDDADGIIPHAFHQGQIVRVKARAPFADKTSRFFNTECLQQHLGHFRIFFIHSPGNHRLRIRERPGQLPCLDGNSSFANDIRAIVVPPRHVCGGIPSNALNIAQVQQAVRLVPHLLQHEQGKGIEGFHRSAGFVRDILPDYLKLRGQFSKGDFHAARRHDMIK